MILLREATIDDLETLRHWDKQPHVNKSDPNDDWHWETELPKKHYWRELLIAEMNSTPLGFIQIIDPAVEETHYWGEIGSGYRAIDIWIGESYNLGKGYGTSMMNLALQRCFSAAEVHSVLIDPLASNTKAIRFYERLGFRFVENRRFGDDDCKVYMISRMQWLDRDLDQA